MGHTIAVGVDGSQPSDVALCWAAARAEHIGARLVVAHVGDESGIADPLGQTAARRLLAEAGERARAMAPHAVVDTVLLVGDPMWELARALPGVDALVVGSHKTGFLRGEAYGSRSLHLIAAATVPVVTIPAGTDRTGRGIAVGLDDSPSGRLALEFAARQAELTAQELVLVLAVPARRDPATATATTANATTADAGPTHVGSSRLEAARKHVIERWPTVRVRSRLVSGPAAPALVRAAARSALLVLGASRAAFGEPFVVGQVTHDVLLNRSSPTAVVDGTRDRLTIDAVRRPEGHLV